MIRLRALNQESSDESEGEEDIPSITREAQEQHAFAQYSTALSLLREKKTDEAAKVLKEVLQSDVLVDVRKEDIAVHPLAVLKYSCLKNMGTILVQKEDYEGALKQYVQASKLDSSDSMLWYQLGSVALKVNNYELARDAFLDGLHYSPHNWRCLDNVITVFYALQDYLSCLVFISRAFELDPHYVKGLAIRDAIFNEHPNITSLCAELMDGLDIGSFDEKYDAQTGHQILEEAKLLKTARCNKIRESSIPDVCLNRVFLNQPVICASWTSLGKSLVHQHRVQQESLASPLKLSWNLDISKPEKQEDNEKIVPCTDNLPKERINNCESPQPDAICNSHIDEDGPDNDDSKGRKRRRNSLSFLAQWVWGGKRRSARVRSTVRREAEREECNLEEVLRRLMPASLLPTSLKEEKPKDVDIGRSNDDSMDTMDLYKLFENRENNDNHVGENNNCDNKIEKESSVEYFGTELEMTDVKNFFLKHDKEDIIDVCELYLRELCDKWQITWPKDLIRTYLEVYSIMRQHIPHVQLLHSPESIKWIEKDGLMTLLFEELSLDSWLQDKYADSKSARFNERRPLPAEEIGYLELVNDRFFTDHQVLMRILWLKAHAYLNNGNIEIAAGCLQPLLSYLEDCEESSDVKIILTNCLRNRIISKETVQTILTVLYRNQNLSEVQYLYEEKHYEELVEILKETFNYCQQPGLVECNNSSENCPDRPTQLAMLMDALWQLKHYQECFHWGEACCNEAFHKYLNSEDKEQQKWASTLEKLLAGLESCILKAGLTVVDGPRLPRLVQNLTHIVCHQLEAPETVISMPIESVNPWIILQQILQWEEEKGTVHTITAEDDEELPGYISILFTAHEFLSRRSWCCSNEGALLLHTMDVVISQIHKLQILGSRDKLMQGMEQVFYCLYAHPNKKTKVRSSLQDHGVPPVQLTWDHALKLYQFYQPRELPEFDSYRVSSITADVEILLKRIIDLIPPQCNPAIMAEKMNQYIEGQLAQLPRPPGGYIPLPRQISSIYYLLGDYYFKNNEWAKAIQHYLLDVCVNPVRLDSWAGMALARGSMLETKLNSCEMLKSEAEFLKQASCAQRCFRRSLEIDSTHSLLWIEYGSFVYTVHSFCSRLLKQETDSLNLEMFEVLETQKEEMLDIAIRCFTTANKVWYSMGEDSGLQDERWLHHYMLGKAAEKNNLKPSMYLEHYSKASHFLHVNGASYSRKISYSNPQNFSVEALEVFYRMHASILKWLEQNEGREPDKLVLLLFQRCLQEIENGPFMAKINKDMEGRQDSDEEKTKRPGSGSEEFLPPTKRPRVDHIADSSLMEQIIDLMEDIICKVADDADKYMSADSIHEYETSKPDKHISADTVNNCQTSKPPGNIVEIIISDESRDTLNNCVANSDSEKCTANTTDKSNTWDFQVEPVVEKIKEENMNFNEEYEKEQEERNEDMSPQVENHDAAAPIKHGTADDIVSTRRSSQESTTTTTTTTSTTGTTETSGGNSSSSSENDSSSSDDSSDSYSSSSESSDDESDDSQSGDTVNVTSVNKDKPKEIHKMLEVTKEETISQTELENMNCEEICEDLIKRCLVGLEECVLRFPQHYKSLYRLTHFYFRYKSHKDVQKCRDLLLGCYTCQPLQGRPKGASFQGLFAERKNNNFFNGVWRIPVPEVDRPGSFASHMSRCVLLLMDVLKELQDHGMLLELCLQLRRTPDPDKKYLRDSEREQLSRQALSLALQTLRSRLHRESTISLMLDVYKSYQRIQKHLPHKETLFASLLIDAYKKHKQIESVEVEQVVQFCQHELATIRSAQISSNNCLSTSSPNILVEGPQQNTPVTTFQSTAAKTIPAHSSQSLHPNRTRGRPPGSSKVVSDEVGSDLLPVKNNGAKSSSNWNNSSQKTFQQPAQVPTQNNTHSQSISPYYNLHSVFSDPTFLSSAMKTKMPSIGLDPQLALSMFQAQISGFQADFLRHFAGSAQMPSNFFGTLPSSFNANTLPSGAFKADGDGLPSPQSQSTVSDFVKDRPSISITPITNSAGKNTVKGSHLSSTNLVQRTENHKNNSSGNYSSSQEKNNHSSPVVTSGPNTLNYKESKHNSRTLLLNSCYKNKEKLTGGSPQGSVISSSPVASPSKTAPYKKHCQNQRDVAKLTNSGDTVGGISHTQTFDPKVNINNKADYKSLPLKRNKTMEISDGTSKPLTSDLRNSKASRNQTSSLHISPDITLTSQNSSLSVLQKLKPNNFEIIPKNKEGSVSIHPVPPIVGGSNFSSETIFTSQDETAISRDNYSPPHKKIKDTISIVEVTRLKAPLKRPPAIHKRPEEIRRSIVNPVEVITIE